METKITYILPGRLEGFGQYGLEDRSASEAPNIFNFFLTSFIGLLTVIAAVYFFFVIIIGAINWIGSGGDRGKIEAARDRISMGLVGMAIVVAAIFIIEIIGNLLGFPSILDPGSLIPILSP